MLVSVVRPRIVAIHPREPNPQDLGPRRRPHSVSQQSRPTAPQNIFLNDVRGRRNAKPAENDFCGRRSKLSGRAAKAQFVLARQRTTE